MQFVDYTDSISRLPEGHIALQVHGGLEFVNGKDWVGVDGDRRRHRLDEAIRSIPKLRLKELK